MKVVKNCFQVAENSGILALLRVYKLLSRGNLRFADLAFYVKVYPPKRVKRKKFEIKFYGNKLNVA